MSDTEELAMQKAVKELRAELKKQRARCAKICAVWDSCDRDCEIYGINHPSPSNCTHFIIRELRRREKEKKKW